MSTVSPAASAEVAARLAGIGYVRAPVSGSAESARSGGLMELEVGALTGAGRYPEVGLADGRKAREAAREQLAKGEDPSFKKKMAKVAAKVASESTFEAAAEESVEKLKLERQAGRTLQKTEWPLSLAYPNLGSWPIVEFTAPEVLAVLQKRGAPRPARIRLASPIHH